MKEIFRVVVLIARPFFHCDPTVQNFMDLAIKDFSQLNRN